MCPLPGTDESFQDTPLQREIQSHTKSSVLHSGPLLLVAPQPEPVHPLMPWWFLEEVVSPSERLQERVDSWEGRLEAKYVVVVRVSRHTDTKQSLQTKWASN